MRSHRFIGPFDLSKKELAVDDGELVSQWRNVLRLGVGDRVILSDGAGLEAKAVIIHSAKGEVRLTLESVDAPARGPKKQVTLYCALLKRENFELVAQKAAEIGIGRIVPLITERTVKTGFGRERLERIVKEASEQSGRTTVPVLADPLPFSEALSSANPGETTLFDLGGTPFADFDLKNFITFNLFIGPEGGFSESEAEEARAAKVAVASLGGLTLRAETAAVVACYLAVQ